MTTDSEKQWHAWLHANYDTVAAYRDARAALYKALRDDGWEWQCDTDIIEDFEAEVERTGVNKR